MLARLFFLLCLGGVAHSALLACPDLNGTVPQLVSICTGGSCGTCLSAIETSVAPALKQAGYAANSSGFVQCMLSFQLELEAAGVNASAFADCATSSSSSSSSSTSSSDAGAGAAATPPPPPVMPPPPAPRSLLPPAPANAPGPATSSSVDRSGASAAIAVCVLLAAGLCGVACVRLRKRMRSSARVAGGAAGLPFANAERRSWTTMPLEER